MVQTVSAADIKVNDILELRGKPDFQRPGGLTYGVVREKITAPGDARTVDSVVVFEIVPDTLRNRLPTNLRLAPLNNENLRPYGLIGAASWSVVIDPVGVKIDENEYYLSRTGTLRGDDIATIQQHINEMSGDTYLGYGRSGVGPSGFSAANWDKLGGRPVRRSSVDAEIEKETGGAARKQRAPKGLEEPLRLVDLPMAEAVRLTNLDPAIVDGLRRAGIESLRTAWEMTKTPDVLTALFPHRADALGTLSLDDAIAHDFLPEDTKGLVFVREPIGTAKPVTTLNELFALTQNDGEGLNSYTGLASKTAASRRSLIVATAQAWEKYNSETPADLNVVAALKRAWSDFTTDYRDNVRPYLTDKLDGSMKQPDSVPDRYKRDGKLILTFPAIKVR